MRKSDLENFGDYLVYEIVGENVHNICVCKEYKVAETIAKLLASMDKNYDTYYVTSINNPGDFVPGGGWYECWHKDKETGKLKHSSLS